LVEQAISAAMVIRYPHQTHLLDDGHKVEYRRLAEKLGAFYLSRTGNEDYKAGNINYALAQTNGEFVAIFDVDHLPAQNFLDRVLGFFKNPKIAFVQAMLSHYNDDESYVATGAAQRNDGFFGPIMLGLFGCRCVQAFGSNCVFRRGALDSLGGYKPGLAEDLITSIHLHSLGWESYYVPEVLAKGLEPVDIASFFKQQLKWSRGVFTILWGILPRLARKMSFRKNLAYVWRLTCYLWGPVITFHIMLTILLLFYGSEITFAYFADYLINSVPLVLMFILINQFVDNNYRLVPKSTKYPFAGSLLAFGTWPVYTLSFFYSVLNIRVPFMATPKEANRKNLAKFILPQIVTVLFLLGGCIWRMIVGLNADSLLTIFFALSLVLMHCGLFFAVFQNSRAASSSTNHSMDMVDRQN